MSMKPALVRAIYGAAGAVVAFLVFWVVTRVLAMDDSLPGPLLLLLSPWTILVVAAAAGAWRASRAEPPWRFPTRSLVTLVVAVGITIVALPAYAAITENRFLDATDRNIENSEEEYEADWRDQSARLTAGQQACDWLSDQPLEPPYDSPLADRFVWRDEDPSPWQANFALYVDELGLSGHQEIQGQLWVTNQAWKLLCPITAAEHDIRYGDG